MSQYPDTLALTVATQNVLLDYTRTKKGLVLPQDDRIGSIAATFEQHDGDFDVVAIQEAHKSKAQHNGIVLSQQLGYGDGFWVQHNEKLTDDARKGRPNEFMGVFGDRVEHAEIIDIGDHRKAIYTTIADIAFVSVHLRSGFDSRYDRQHQAHPLVDSLADFTDAVILGDLNEPPIAGYALARKVLNHAGFTSVFDTLQLPRPKTSPIAPYRRAAMSGRHWQAPFMRLGWSIDDIQIRGEHVTALSAGVLERVIADVRDGSGAETAPREGSDHDGLWARLAVRLCES